MVVLSELAEDAWWLARAALGSRLPGGRGPHQGPGGPSERARCGPDGPIYRPGSEPSGGRRLVRAHAPVGAELACSVSRQCSVFRHSPYGKKVVHLAWR
jgi:hypothetical protein